MEPLNLPQLPRTFYEQHRNLAHVLKAANARRAAPDVALLATLGRLAALAPVDVTVNGSTLNLCGAFVGRSGSGKTTGYRVARDVVPDIGTDADGVGLSSGEGVIERYMGNQVDVVDGRRETHRAQVRTAALFYVDEGEALLKVGRREGSITLATLRSAWAGETLGTSGARAETTRHLQHGTYRFVLLVGIQPTYASELLAVAHDGTPQRFLWVGAGDKYADDSRAPHPGALHLPTWPTGSVEVDRHVLGVVDRQQVDNLRNGGAHDEHETHATLNQLRTAALFAALIGDAGKVTPDAWNLAAELVDLGRGIRAELLAHADRAAVERRDEEAVQAVDRRDREYDANIRRIANLLCKYANAAGPGPHTSGALTRLLAGRDRRQLLIVDDAFRLALNEGRLRQVDDDLYEPVR